MDAVGLVGGAVRPPLPVIGRREVEEMAEDDGGLVDVPVVTP